MGQTVGGWPLLEAIGGGGFGAVFRTELPRHPLPRWSHIPPGARYAIKVCKEMPARDVVHGFGRELKAVAVLDGHPGVVPVLDSGFHEQLPFLVMPLQRGNLAELITTQGPLGVRQAGQLLEPVAMALKAADAAGIRHRDIRPANVLIGFDDRARLSDFGIAVLTDEYTRLTPVGVVIGDPSYLSPEYLRGRSADLDSDLWMLSCTLFAVTTGRKAFVAHAAASRSWGDVERRGVPAELRPFFAKALSARMSDRFRSVDAWYEALQVAGGGAPVRARAARQVPVRPRNLSPVLVSLLTALCALALVAFLVH